MSLRDSFAQASSSKAINISSLEEKPYTIVGEERWQTKYGISTLLTIKASSEDLVRVFLPRPFTNVFSDTDIDMIYGEMIKIDLIYHGAYEKTNAYQLSLKQVRD